VLASSPAEFFFFIPRWAPSQTISRVHGRVPGTLFLLSIFSAVYLEKKKNDVLSFETQKDRKIRKRYQAFRRFIALPLIYLMSVEEAT
jgi:hypothetical protein